MIQYNDIAAGNYFADETGTIVKITGIEHNSTNHDRQVYYIYPNKPDKKHWLGLETFRRLDIRPL